jgi:hypothetical protein
MRHKQIKTQIQYKGGQIIMQTTCFTIHSTPGRYFTYVDKQQTLPIIYYEETFPTRLSFWEKQIS